MNITVASVGKLKEKYLKQAVAEYAKRLSAYCRLAFIEVPDQKAPDSLSEKEELQLKDKEGEALLKKIKDGQHVIVLDLAGKQLSSESFSKEIDRLALSGKSDLVFVIGGSLGLSQAVLDRADFSLSFSKMTFPHQLMKVILLEQIYRSFRISRNEPYHK